jgi:signal transduction histidine kinase
LKSDFVSTVSHELRTPLTSIREAISQVEDGIVGQISREQHEVLSIALEEVDRLARLINDVLDISQIEAGIISLQKSEFAISACLKKIEASFSRTITEKRLKLTIKVDQPVPRVYADPDKFDQILTNIIGNAVKFTHSGGEIVIAVLKKESCTEFRISDTGIGISPDNLKRLFVKFQQFGQPAEGSPRGTGLGLAITKELVEMHGGLIRATSSLGQGTCITFTMPVAEKA